MLFIEGKCLSEFFFKSLSQTVYLDRNILYFCARKH